jgi:hypothetical protein
VLKAQILNRLSIVVLENAAFISIATTNHDVAQAHVMFRTQSSATNTDHKANPNVREAMEHVPPHYCRRYHAVFSLGQAGHDDVVMANPAKRVYIVISQGDILQAIISFIEELLGSDKFSRDSGDPANYIFLGAQHISKTSQTCAS